MDERAELGVFNISGPFCLDSWNPATEVQKPCILTKSLVPVSQTVQVSKVDLLKWLMQDLGTHAFDQITQTASQTGDYIGLKFNKAVPVQNLTFVMGNSGKSSWYLQQR